MYTIESYAIRIKHKDSKNGNYLKLDKFDGRSNLIDIIRQYIGEYSIKTGTIELRNQLFTTSLLKTDKRFFSGRIFVGEYGFTTNIVNIQSGAVSYRKRKSDADLHPYDFLFYIPEASDGAILLILKKSGQGPLSIIETILKHQFNKNFKSNNISMEINPLQIASAIDFLNKGDLKKIRYTKTEVPSDIADKVNGDRNKTQGSIELIVKPERGLNLNPKNYIDYLFGKYEGENIYEFHGIIFDNIKAQIDVNGRKRTISISNHSGVKASYEVTEELGIANDGFAEHESTIEHMQSILSDICNIMGIKT
jgi:hypothetical protein